MRDRHTVYRASCPNRVDKQRVVAWKRNQEPICIVRGIVSTRTIPRTRPSSRILAEESYLSSIYFSLICLRILDKYAIFKDAGCDILERASRRIFLIPFPFSFLSFFFFRLFFLRSPLFGKRSSERCFSTFNLYVCIDRRGYRKIKY